MESPSKRVKAETVTTEEAKPTDRNLDRVKNRLHSDVVGLEYFNEDSCSFVIYIEYVLERVKGMQKLAQDLGVTLPPDELDIPEYIRRYLYDPYAANVDRNA